MKDEDPPLEASGIGHRYGDLRVLEDVTSVYDAGEVTAILGANGSGKTTYLKILAGLLQPTEGEVALSVDDVERERGYLPQQPSFRPRFSVRETLGFYGGLLGYTRDGDYVDRALEDVGLQEAGDRAVDALSGGMTRLLGVAQARLGDPPVLLLDEPTSGLDPSMTARIYEVLGKVADEGAAVVHTTHDLDAAERGSDVIEIVHDGGVSVRGPPDELRREHDASSLLDVFEAVVDGGEVS
ncbi:MAG: ABC transporter ATP-binding protein [Halobacteriota archaeon]